MRATKKYEMKFREEFSSKKLLNLGRNRTPQKEFCKILLKSDQKLGKISPFLPLKIRLKKLGNMLLMLLFVNRNLTLVIYFMKLFFPQNSR